MTTSSVHSIDDGEAVEQQKHSEPQIQPSPSITHPGIAGITPSSMHYASPAPAVGTAMTQAAYPYPDPYYRSIFAPYDAQPYPSQSMVHLQLMGIQQGGVPLPSDAIEEPVFVNAKQYHGIMRRRQSRAKAELEKNAAKSRKPYLHESRHLHALRRARGNGGRFQKKSSTEQNEVESGDKSQSNVSLNLENGAPTSSQSA